MSSKFFGDFFWSYPANRQTDGGRKQNLGESENRQMSKIKQFDSLAGCTDNRTQQ